MSPSFPRLLAARARARRLSRSPLPVGRAAGGRGSARPGQHGAQSAHKAGAKHEPEPPEPGEEPLEPGEIKVRAESYEQTSKGHVEARGLVDLRVADIRIQADKADVFEDKQPDGSTKQRIVAEGNVVFIRGEERLSGDRLEMDDTGKGTLLNAVGYLEPGVFVEARQIERLDADSYRVVGGTFTSCAQPNPRWNFSASRAKVDVDDKITGTNAVFKVKGVPAFYTPYIYYPISKEPPLDGLPAPEHRLHSTRGYILTTGFFWAMGRSADQTFSFDYYSKTGYGLGHELRWVGSTPSRGTLRSVVFDLKGSEQVRLRHRLERPAGASGQAARGGGACACSATLLFLQQYQGDFARASARTERWSASLERDFGFAILNAYGDTTNTFYGTDTRQVSGRVPGLSLRRFPRQIGLGRARLRAGGLGGEDPLRHPEQGGRLDALRHRPDAVASAARELPGHQPVGRLPLHALRGERPRRREREPAYDENGELERSGPPARPLVLRDLARHARAHLRARLRHARLRLLRPLQAHDRAGDHLDLQDARRRLRRDPEVRRAGLLPGHERDPTTRSRSASTPSAAARAGRRCPTSSSRGG